MEHVLNFGSRSDIQQQPGSAATSSSIDDSDQHTDAPAGRDLQQRHLPEGAKSRLGKGVDKRNHVFPGWHAAGGRELYWDLAL